MNEVATAFQSSTTKVIDLKSMFKRSSINFWKKCLQKYSLPSFQIMIPLHWQTNMSILDLNSLRSKPWDSLVFGSHRKLSWLEIVNLQFSFKIHQVYFTKTAKEEHEKPCLVTLQSTYMTGVMQEAGTSRRSLLPQK